MRINKNSFIIVTLMLILGAFRMLFALDTTPRQAEGPYYPQVTVIPNQSNTDWNLLVLNDGKTLYQGNGVRLLLKGKVLKKDGSPIAGAQVDIWQTDEQGIYLHSRAPYYREFNKTFQGFGSTITDKDGNYIFITIIPVEYKDDNATRPPHIHVKVKDISKKRPKNLLITQIYLKDHPSNTKDFLFRSAKHAEDMLSVNVTDTQITDELMGAIYAGKTANFDIVIK